MYIPVIVTLTPLTPQLSHCKICVCVEIIYTLEFEHNYNTKEC